jgi:hypothetical protein
MEDRRSPVNVTDGCEEAKSDCDERSNYDAEAAATGLHGTQTEIPRLTFSRRTCWKS